jgi:hypothetical protein
VRCDLEAAEHALDLVAVTIGALARGKGLAAIDLVGNDRGGAAPRKPIPERGAVISLIDQQFFGWRQGLEQRRRGFAVEALSAAQEKAQRAALAINHRMDFCRAATPACAKRLVLAPFLPRAERCALIAVESMLFS